MKYLRKNQPTLRRTSNEAALHRGSLYSRVDRDMISTPLLDQMLAGCAGTGGKKFRPRTATSTFVLIIRPATAGARVRMDSCGDGDPGSQLQPTLILAFERHTLEP